MSHAKRQTDLNKAMVRGKKPEPPLKKSTLLFTYSVLQSVCCCHECATLGRAGRIIRGCKGSFGRVGFFITFIMVVLQVYTHTHWNSTHFTLYILAVYCMLIIPQYSCYELIFPIRIPIPIPIPIALESQICQPFWLYQMPLPI